MVAETGVLMRNMLKGIVDIKASVQFEKFQRSGTVGTYLQLVEEKGSSPGMNLQSELSNEIFLSRKKLLDQQKESYF